MQSVVIDYVYPYYINDRKCIITLPSDLSSRHTQSIGMTDATIGYKILVSIIEYFGYLIRNAYGLSISTYGKQIK